MIGILASASQAFADGSFIYSNVAVGAPVYVEYPNILTDTTYKFDFVYAEAANVTNESLLTYTGPATNGRARGLFAGGIQTIAGYSGTISMEIRCWSGSFSTYADAIASTNSYYGHSAIFNLPLGDSTAEPPQFPTPLDGYFSSFVLTGPGN